MELKHNIYSNRQRNRELLIVPYGIETSSTSLKPDKNSLLIVPYGIETSSEVKITSSGKAFNRTLWN